MDLVLYIPEFDHNMRFCGIITMFVYWSLASIDIIDITQKISCKVNFMTKPITNNAIPKILRPFGLLSYRKHSSFKLTNFGDQSFCFPYAIMKSQIEAGGDDMIASPFCTS